MPTNTHNLGLFTIGDTFCIDIDNIAIPGVRNNGPGIAQNVRVTLTIPAGIELVVDGSTVSKGIFSDITGIWSVGSLIKNEVATGSFCFEVIDDCDSPFIIEFNVDSDACECTISNNSFTVVASGISCCAMNNCRPCDIYRALISQSGTNNPTVVVLENTLPGPIVWTRIDAGIYNGTLSGAFITANTYFSIDNSGPLTPLPLTFDVYHRRIGVIPDNIVQIITGDDGGFYSDGLLEFNPIEIRVVYSINTCIIKDWPVSYLNTTKCRKYIFYELRSCK